LKTPVQQWSLQKKWGAASSTVNNKTNKVIAHHPSEHEEKSINSKGHLPSLPILRRGSGAEDRINIGLC